MRKSGKPDFRCHPSFRKSMMDARVKPAHDDGGCCAFIARRPDSIIKQPSVIILAAGGPRELQIVFRFTPSREGAERRRAHPGCLPFAKDRRRSCETGSPYGAPLRRLWTVGPLCLAGASGGVTGPDITGDATEDSIRGSLVSQEAFSTRPPRARLRIVHAGSPLPLHIWLACADAPLSEGGCGQSISKDNSSQ